AILLASQRFSFVASVKLPGKYMEIRKLTVINCQGLPHAMTCGSPFIFKTVPFYADESGNVRQMMKTI
ncbi:hypothetical protein, partial [uncultured Megasphaera sp.]|uniref:hypothetical protein n=1 Tax=uncultured Megasphaera sp. TaxID=165188 RepID=UPI0025FE733C